MLETLALKVSNLIDVEHSSQSISKSITFISQAEDKYPKDCNCGGFTRMSSFDSVEARASPFLSTAICNQKTKMNNLGNMVLQGILTEIIHTTHFVFRFVLRVSRLCKRLQCFLVIVLSKKNVHYQI